MRQFPPSENPLDYFAEMLWKCLHCPRRRRWLICMPWLALPFLFLRAISWARSQTRDYRVRCRIDLLSRAGRFGESFAVLAEYMDEIGWTPEGIARLTIGGVK